MRIGEWKAIRGLTVLEAGIYPRGTVVVVDASISAAYGYCVYVGTGGVPVRYEHPLDNGVVRELATLQPGEVVDVMVEVMQVKDCYIKRWVWTNVQVKPRAMAA